MDEMALCTGPILWFRKLQMSLTWVVRLRWKSTNFVHFLSSFTKKSSCLWHLTYLMLIANNHFWYMKYRSRKMTAKFCKSNLIKLFKLYSIRKQRREKGFKDKCFLYQILRKINLLSPYFNKLYFTTSFSSNTQIMKNSLNPITNQFNPQLFTDNFIRPIQ